MSLLSANKLIDIKLFYQLIKKDGYEKVKILTEKQGKEKIFQNEEMKKEFEKDQKDQKDQKDIEKFVLDPNDKVHILNTKWKEINWKEQNTVLENCRSTNQYSGLPEIDNLKFRDQRLKMCLKDWDLKDDNGNPVPCNPEVMEQLPFDVIYSLINNFDKIVNLDEEEEKKS